MASLKVRHMYVSYNLCVCRPKMSVKTRSKAREDESEKQLVVYTNDVVCVYTHMHMCTHSHVNTKICLLSLDMFSQIRYEMMYEGKHAAPQENQPNVRSLRYTWKQEITNPKNVDTKVCEKHLGDSANVSVFCK